MILSIRPGAEILAGETASNQGSHAVYGIVPGAMMFALIRESRGLTSKDSALSRILSQKLPQHHSKNHSKNHSHNHSQRPFSNSNLPGRQVSKRHFSKRHWKGGGSRIVQAG